MPARDFGRRPACLRIATAIAILTILAGGADASPVQQPAVETSTVAPVSAPLPAGYVIGPDDVLSIVFWRDKEMSSEVIVRPDGKISLPLLNDVQAAGFTPEALRESVTAAAAKYLEEPSATVIVKEIHSRKVYITGQVSKPGTYPLHGGMNVLHLIAEAGGLLEYARSKDIVVIRSERSREQRFKFNYQDMIRGRRVEQNIALRPGDTVIVP